MFKLEDVMQLKPMEEVRLVAKRHAVTVIPSLILAFLLIVVPFFFMFPLFKTGPTGVVVFVACVIAGIVIAWRTFVIWDGDTFIVSNVRVLKVDQTGIFSRTVTEAGAMGLTDIAWVKRGIPGYVFNYGTLSIGAPQKISVKHLSNPQSVHALLNEIVDFARTKEVVSASRESKEERIRKLADRLDDADLLAIERALNKDGRETAINEFFHSEPRPERRASVEPHPRHTELELNVTDGIVVKRVDGSGLKPLK